MVSAAIALRVQRELSMMHGALGDRGDSVAFVELGNWMDHALERIGELIVQGAIDPQRPNRAGRGVGHSPLRGSTSRIGVFPTAANPLHWGHLVGGLAAMERFHLDKVYYVIAGHDPRKPTMAPAGVRHSIAREVLRLFEPLFEYSPVALGNEDPGEINVFRIVSSGARPLHAFYLAGSDHYHRLTSRAGSPDTIQRLETGVHHRIHGFDPRVHGLSAIFLDRGNPVDPIESDLDIRWIKGLPLQSSSTKIRGALNGSEPLCELAALPFSAYCAICAHGMYPLSADCVRPAVQALLLRELEASSRRRESGSPLPASEAGLPLYFGD
jgi:nicotinic acid mononucleotide adenylyltransferase